MLVMPDLLQWEAFASLWGSEVYGSHIPPWLGMLPRALPSLPASRAGMLPPPSPSTSGFFGKTDFIYCFFLSFCFFSPAAEPKNSRMGSGGAAICMQNGAICLPAAGFCSGTWQGWQQGCGGQQDGDSPQTITDALHIPLIPLGLVPCDPLLRDRDPLVQAHLETL